MESLALNGCLELLFIFQTPTCKTRLTKYKISLLKIIPEGKSQNRKLAAAKRLANETLI